MYIYDNNDTNIDGNNIAETTSDIQGSNSYHVIFANGVDNTALLEGFIITAGKASGSSHYSTGGGMYIKNSSLFLNDLIFSGNLAADGGGGVNNTNSSNPTMTNLTFSGNAADSGGGLQNADTSGPKLTNLVFSGNTASKGGGGMFNDNSSPILVNSTFSNNLADNGGGIANTKSNPDLSNTILWGNNASSLGNQVYNDASTPTIVSSLIQDCGNSGTGWDASLGTDNGHNIDKDPLFVDPDGIDSLTGTLDDNLRLQNGSPANNIGNNSAIPSEIFTDRDGNPRIIGIVDLGAYESALRICLPLILKNAN